MPNFLKPFKAWSRRSKGLQELAFILGAMIFLVVATSCGGGGSTPPPPPVPTITAVTISPNPVTLNVSQQQQFTATVTGTGSYSTAVTWSANGGTLGSTSGSVITWTAPPTAGSYSVNATSNQDSSKAGTVTVTVTQPIVIQLTPSPATTTVNRTIYFNATASGVTNPSFQWQVVSGGQGNINDGYFYTAYAGNYRVRATYAPTGQFAEANVTVTSTPTLVGDDSNGNGVRDDVDALINSWNVTSAQKSTLTVVAQQIQSMIVLGANGNPNADTAYTLAQNLDTGSISLSESLPTYQSYVGSVLANTLNTQDRSNAYIAVEKAIGGRYFPLRASMAESVLTSGDAATQATSNVCASGYQVMFLNGVDNTKQEAFGSMLDLRSAVGQIYSGESVHTGLLYNPTDGLLTDLAEAFKQKAQADPRILGRWDLFWSVVFFVPIGEPSTTIVKDLIATKTLAYLQSTIRGTDPDKWVQKFTQDVDTKLLEGFKVVIVAHSQGNLFASSVYRAVLAAHPAYANSIKVVHVAAVNGQADLVGPWWNADIDIVVNGLRSTLDPTIPGPNIPPYPSGAAICPDIFNIWTFPRCEWGGHSFRYIYLNANFPGRTPIIGSVQNAMSSLVPPPQTGILSGLFTGTLTWSHNADVDLHVYEPDGTHVYWANKLGISGQLDRDDTVYTGPEHYSTYCESSRIQTGVYTFAVNYFSGNGSVDASVQLNTKTASYPAITKTFPTARGSLGDSTPITFFKVSVTKDQNGNFIVQPILTSDQPYITSFTATPSNITAGQSATLYPVFINATSASIDHGVGSVISGGGYTVTPSATTTYTLTANGTSGPASSTVTVTVTGTQPSSITSVSVSPNPVNLNVSQQQAFTSTVTGTGSYSAAVTWSVDGGSPGGSITSSGVYTAPGIAGTYHVRATSIQDNSKLGTAIVTVRSGSGIPRKSIAAGSGFSLVLKPDDTVRAWGQNWAGQLGDGTTTERHTPVVVVGLNGVVALAGGLVQSYALKSDGTVWAWGRMAPSQINGDHTTPVQVPGLTDIVALAGADSHSLALKRDGTVWAWGGNWYGQLGNGTLDSGTSLPAQVIGLTSVTAIAAGGAHGLALISDGTVWAWGSNYQGELGDGTTVGTRSTPAPVSNLTGVVALASGSQHCLALKSDGTVWAWGREDNGQLGDGQMSGIMRTPGQVSVLTGIAGIASGYWHSFALKSDGTVWAWGLGDVGQLGDGTTTTTRATPAQVSALTGVVALEGGDLHSLAIKSDGTVWAWGSNLYGQLGDGTTVNKSVPTQVILP